MASALYITQLIKSDGHFRISISCLEVLLTAMDNPFQQISKIDNVHWNNTKISAGVFGTVEEVSIPGGVCAAMKIHDFLQAPDLVPSDTLREISQQLVKECEFLASVKDRNIAKFMGICNIPGSILCLPALVMERLQYTLHDCIIKGNLPSSLGKKSSILDNVACGLEYLHQQTPPIIHGALSAKNISLNLAMPEAKIIDLGLARVDSLVKAASSMIGTASNWMYMPPEVAAPCESCECKTNTSVDIFSFGVLTIFTIGEVFPSNPLPHSYMDKSTGVLVPRTEQERRENYMKHVRQKLGGYYHERLRENNPFLQIIQRCLHNFPDNRPSINEVLQLLNVVRADLSDENSDGSEHLKIAHPVNEEVQYNCYNII